MRIRNKAEKIEIAENLFRVDLTVLERGQQLKRWKELESPETNQGGDRKSEEFKSSKRPLEMGEGTYRKDDATKIKSQDVRLDTPRFTKAMAEKTGQSERAIQRDIQIATHIPEKVQTLIKDLPVADNKSAFFCAKNNTIPRTFFFTFQVNNVE